MSSSARLTLADFEVRASTVKAAGKGLFARTPISSGESLGFFTGKILTDRQAERVAPRLRKYLVPVCKDHVILGDTKLRFINHSYRPNVRMLYSNRWKTARLEAIRRIRPGEEIFVEYDPEFMRKMGMDDVIQVTP